MPLTRVLIAFVLPLLCASPLPAADRPSMPNYSGIYPHLAYYNNEGECGTGAVVPFAERLWVITYGPHLPNGSSDKLYEITADLVATIRPESIGGTPANRMIHRESNQLFIGPYAIDAERNVRVIPYQTMPGRHTANMRHLTDPANKIYYATMEEGFYEVDVKSLEVRQLYPDANRDKGGLAGSLLPGYHGKGAYSGQGHVVYANNGETSAEARQRPDVPSGCLAEWDGKNWTVVKRNQFCDVTGPGGIMGNADADRDPIWSIGWDHRSLLLMLREAGNWHLFRLPKATHTYDGAHGWNTEWPRIRDIGEETLLMTMHGTFWHFPKTFSLANTAGIRPRSTYLKVIGDFCRWNERLVFGCDDTAKSEFLNKRKAKGDIAGPGQSQSNLWFADPAILDQLGEPLGRGAVWMNEPVPAGKWSDPYLFAGYQRRGVHLAHQSAGPVTFEFEVDRDGHGEWLPLKSVTVPASGYAWCEFPSDEQGQWVRVRLGSDAEKVTAFFQYGNEDRRGLQADPLFDGLAAANAGETIGGLVRARGEDKRTLALIATVNKGTSIEEVGYYELDGQMRLRRVEDPAALTFTRDNTVIPKGILGTDAASVVYVDDTGKRWRLPKGDAAFDTLTGGGLYRIDREVVTERDLFNCHGTFYELPAQNAGGFAKIRPISTHNRLIHDYCSYRGMVILTGIAGGQGNPHVVRSEDGKAAVWAGVVDDLWKLGKAVGRGGPWKDSAVTADKPSDPYLMTGYDKKRLTLSHSASETVAIRVEVDITGDGMWQTYMTFEVAPGQSLEHEFPAAFGRLAARHRQQRMHGNRVA